MEIRPHELRWKLSGKINFATGGEYLINAKNFSDLKKKISNSQIKEQQLLFEDQKKQIAEKRRKYKERKRRERWGEKKDLSNS